MPNRCPCHDDKSCGLHHYLCADEVCECTCPPRLSPMVKVKIPRFKKDVSFHKGKTLEYGLTTGKPHSTPTLFVSAICRTKADAKWFEKVVKALTTETR